MDAPGRITTPLEIHIPGGPLEVPGNTPGCPREVPGMSRDAPGMSRDVPGTSWDVPGTCWGCSSREIPDIPGHPRLGASRDILGASMVSRGRALDVPGRPEMHRYVLRRPWTSWDVPMASPVRPVTVSGRLHGIPWDVLGRTGDKHRCIDDLGVLLCPTTICYIKNTRGDMFKDMFKGYV